MGPMFLIFTNGKAGLDQIFNTNPSSFNKIFFNFRILLDLQKCIKWYKKYPYTPHPVSSTRFFFNLLFIFGCARSSLLCRLFSSFGEQGLLSHCSMRASHLLWLLLLQSTGFRRCRLQQLRHVGPAFAAAGLQSTGSVVVVHGLRCRVACGVFPDQG